MPQNYIYTIIIEWFIFLIMLLIVIGLLVIIILYWNNQRKKVSKLVLNSNSQTVINIDYLASKTSFKRRNWVRKLNSKKRISSIKNENNLIILNNEAFGPSKKEQTSKDNFEEIDLNSWEGWEHE